MTCYLVIPPKIITYFYSSLQRQMKTIAKVKKESDHITIVLNMGQHCCYGQRQQ